MSIKYTKHAREMLVLRGIKKELVNEAVNNPDDISPAREGKKIYLKDFGKNYLKLHGYPLNTTKLGYAES